MYLLSFSMYGFISNGGNVCKYVLTYIIDSFLLAYLLTIQGPSSHGCLAPVTFETLLGGTRGYGCHILEVRL